MRNAITTILALFLVGPGTPSERVGATPRPDPLPTLVWLSVGGEAHNADKLVELAVARITKEEGRAPYVGARADVFIHTGDKETLAEVVIGQISKPVWTVTFGKDLQILRYRKGVGRG